MIARAATGGAWFMAVVWLGCAVRFADSRFFIPAVGCAVVAIVLDLTADHRATRAQIRATTTEVDQQAWAEFHDLALQACVATGAHAELIRARQAQLLRTLGHHALADRMTFHYPKGRNQQ